MSTAVEGCAAVRARSYSSIKEKDGSGWEEYDIVG